MPQTTESLYNLLEISINSSIDEIKKSFKRLAKKYHPDVNQGNKTCEEKFKIILNAYEILSDKDRRNEYDLSLNINENFTDKYKKANPYEPDVNSVDDIINILDVLITQLERIKKSKNEADANIFFNILNHILSAEFITKYILISSQAKRNQIIERIIYCFHFLPVHIINILLVKVYLINNMYESKYSDVIKKIIIKRKFKEFIDTREVRSVLYILIVIASIAIVGEILYLLNDLINYISR
jgi:hypothetical protein